MTTSERMTILDMAIKICSCRGAGGTIDEEQVVAVAILLEQYITYGAGALAPKEVGQ